MQMTKMTTTIDYQQFDDFKANLKEQGFVCMVTLNVFIPGIDETIYNLEIITQEEYDSLCRVICLDCWHEWADTPERLSCPECGTDNIWIELTAEEILALEA